MVIVVGEALIDRITRTDGSTSDVVGGGPFNAACALASLGCQTTFVGGISTDVLGDELADALLGADITLALPRVSEPTGIAHVSLAESGSAQYQFELENSACAQVTPADAVAALARTKISAIHVGTLGLVLQPLADSVVQMLHHAPDEVLCFVDPNCRPSLISDRVRYMQRLTRVMARADVVKVSSEDLVYIAPGEKPELAAAALIGGRTKVVLLTRGSDGVDVLTAAGAISLPAAPAQVVDTVGAGDVFGAAWLAWWLRHGWSCEDLADSAKVVQAAQYGVKAASWTVAHVGAQVPTLTDLETPEHE